MNGPDPMVQVLMDTMLIENKETAALLLCRLDDAGYVVNHKPYYHDFEVTHYRLEMACMCDQDGKLELADLIEEYLKQFPEKWMKEHYAPELLFDNVAAGLSILYGAGIELYADQWFGLTVEFTIYAEKKRYIYYIQCDSPLHGLLTVWKQSKQNGHLKET